jgi:ABC-type transport system involved in cytochrome bd biosynthesis fused ATPase/permease subunit
MKIKDRIKSESPKLFKRITNVCIALGVVGGVLATAPVSLPALLVTASGYMITAGAIGASISKLTVKDNKDESND